MSQVVSVGHDLCVVDNQHNSCRVFGLHADQGGAKWKQLFDDRAKREYGPEIQCLWQMQDWGGVGGSNPFGAKLQF